MKDNPILNYWQPILEKWYIIIFGSILSSILALIITLFIPKTYETSATILPIQSSQEDSKLGGGSSNIPNIQRQLGPKISHYLINLITSRRIAEYVVSEMNLQEKLGKISFEKAVEYLMYMIGIEENKYGLITITIQARDPKLSADIANTYVKNLEKFIRDDRVSTTKNQRIFIEEQLTKIKPELILAEDRLKNFKEKNKTITLSENVKREIEGIAKLSAQVFLEENNLVMLRSYSNDENPEIKKLIKNVSLLKQQIKEIEDNSSAINIMLEKELELARLTRDLKIKEQIYIELAVQTETLKVAEAKESKLFTLLDKAIPPERHSKPSKSRNMIFSFVGWIIISTFAIIFKSEFS